VKFTNFLQGITWKDGVWAALAAILIFLNVRSCNSSKDILQVSSSSCDTVEIIQIDSFIEWKTAAIPEPVIDTIEVIKFIEKIVERVDTFTLTEFVPTYISIVDSVPLYAYDSTFETDSYKLRWHIESLGELKVFQHALSFKYEVRQTNNLISKDSDSRKWLLMFEGLAQTDFSTETNYYLGGSLHRSLFKKDILLIGGGYYREIGEAQRKNNIVKASIGIRF